MLRNLGYLVLVATFAAFSVAGLQGWTTAPRFRQDAPSFDDERPLQIGGLVGKALVEYATKGYPWEPLRAELNAARSDLPPDPAPLSAEETESRYLGAQPGMKLKMPSGTVSWPQYVDALRQALEPYSIPLLTPPPQPPDSLEFELPKADFWPGISVIAFGMGKTREQFVAVTTCEGLVIGTKEACNRATHDGKLIGIRCQVAAEHADPKLDVPFRPDLVDASIVAFARAVETQTGIPVVVNAQLWEKGPGLAWRGEPRKLREALDELCVKFRWFWRYRNGRIWLLWP